MGFILGGVTVLRSVPYLPEASSTPNSSGLESSASAPCFRSRRRLVSGWLNDSNQSGMVFYLEDRSGGLQLQAAS